MEKKDEWFIAMFFFAAVALIFQHIELRRLSIAVASVEHQVMISGGLPGAVVAQEQGFGFDKTLFVRNDIKGSVVEIGEDYVDVEASVYDTSKMSGADSPETPPKVKRRFHVLIDSRTQFIGLRRSDIVVGTSVVAVASVLINELSGFNARIIGAPEIPNE